MTTTNIAPAVVPRDQPSGPKLLDRVREAIRLRHYSRRTEESYVAWIRRFIVFHGKRHPSELGSEEIGQYLVHRVLRVLDIDFERHQKVVCRGRGPATVKPPLIAHLADVKRQHEGDLSDGVGRVVLPAALDRKYPNAGTDWVWQFRVSSRAQLPQLSIWSAIRVPSARVRRSARRNRGRQARRNSEAG